MKNIFKNNRTHISKQKNNKKFKSRLRGWKKWTREH
jgi:hypothetical protein